jgi:hypothetical protein
LNKLTAAFATVASALLAAIAAFATPTTGVWDAMRAMSTGQGLPVASATPAFSALATPTLDPIANGPLGTWTAIALTIAPPTINAEPYVVANQGNPHFIEFHAWW